MLSFYLLFFSCFFQSFVLYPPAILSILVYSFSFFFKIFINLFFSFSYYSFCILVCIFLLWCFVFLWFSRLGEEIQDVKGDPLQITAIMPSLSSFPLSLHPTFCRADLVSQFPPCFSLTPFSPPPLPNIFIFVFKL